jgi:hypothetical protein
MPDVELQHVLGFDQEDLAANCMGRLSPKQEKSIRNTQRLQSIIFIGTGIITLLIAIFIFISGLSTSLQNKQGKTIPGIALPAVALGIIAWGSFKLSAQKIDSSVQCVRGKVRFIRVENVIPEKKPNGVWFYRIVEDYQLRVGNVIFENLDRRIFNLLQEQDIYTFYYTKDSKDILSVDHVAETSRKWL